MSYVSSGMVTRLSCPQLLVYDNFQLGMFEIFKLISPKDTCGVTSNFYLSDSFLCNHLEQPVSTILC